MATVRVFKHRTQRCPHCQSSNVFDLGYQLSPKFWGCGSCFKRFDPTKQETA